MVHSGYMLLSIALYQVYERASFLKSIIEEYGIEALYQKGIR